MATIEVNGILNFKDESGNINTVYPVTKAENVEGLENTKVTIDSGLSATSTNPVQNKVIKAEIDKLLPKSGGTMTGKLTLFGDPTSNLHAATKQYVDTGLNEKADAQDLTSHAGNKNNPHGVTAAQVGAVPKSGGTMTGALTLSGNPSSDLHASTKQYVDNSLSGKLDNSGGTMTGALTLSGDPSSNLHAATKQYVDNAVNSNSIKIAYGTVSTGSSGTASVSFGGIFTKVPHVSVVARIDRYYSGYEAYAITPMITEDSLDVNGVDFLVKKVSNSTASSPVTDHEYCTIYWMAIGE